MKNLLILTIFLLVMVSGCRSTPVRPEPPTLEKWQNAALLRHLDGDTNAALTAAAAQNFSRSARHHQFPDIARFIRQSPAGQGSELSRKLLWESAEACNVQFTADPEKMIRTWKADELRCQAALLIAEKQYLDQIIWKNDGQEQRNRELSSELSRLFGSLPFGEIAAIKLADAGDIPDFSAAAEVLSEDPAEALQIAGVIAILPDEIRRQKLANPAFPVDGVLDEIVRLTAGYALHIDRIQFNAALKTYQADPTPANLWHCRQWYYRAMMDIARLPEKRGDREAQQFINSMLLLQEGF